MGMQSMEQKDHHIENLAALAEMKENLCCG